MITELQKKARTDFWRSALDGDKFLEYPFIWKRLYIFFHQLHDIYLHHDGITDDHLIEFMNDLSATCSLHTTDQGHCSNVSLHIKHKSSNKILYIDDYDKLDYKTNHLTIRDKKTDSLTCAIEMPVDPSLFGVQVTELIRKANSPITEGLPTDPFKPSLKDDAQLEYFFGVIDKYKYDPVEYSWVLDGLLEELRDTRKLKFITKEDIELMFFSGANPINNNLLIKHCGTAFTQMISRYLNETKETKQVEVMENKETIKLLAKRYLDIVCKKEEPEGTPIPNADNVHLIWMLSTILKDDNMPVLKQALWLGHVYGVMTAHHFIKNNDDLNTLFEGNTNGD